MEAPGFYFCICPDSTLAREHVSALLDRLSPAGASWERLVFWAEEGLDQRFWENLTLLGLTSRRKALLVRAAQCLPAEVWKKLSAALASPRPGILPIFFLESAWDKGRPKLPAHVEKLKCLEFADRKKWLWRAPGLDPRSLPAYLQKRALPRKMKFSREALQALGELMIPDAAAVENVLDQLNLASGGGEVDAGMVRSVASFSPEMAMFDFVRLLENGRPGEVWKKFLRDGDDGMLFPLLGLLAWDARQLWQTMEGEPVFWPREAMASKHALAARLGRTGLTRLFQMLMEAEWSVKTGARQPRQALEELVAGLTLLFAARSSRGGGL